MMNEDGRTVGNQNGDIIGRIYEDYVTIAGNSNPIVCVLSAKKDGDDYVILVGSQAIFLFTDAGDDSAQWGRYKMEFIWMPTGKSIKTVIK
jgi:hypothetical protein